MPGSIFHHQGDRWGIKIQKTRIFCDKYHRTFYSRQDAERTLHTIWAEIEAGTFDKSFYAKRKKSLRNFEEYALGWLANCERRLQRKELSPTYMREVRRYVHQFLSLSLVTWICWILKGATL